MSPDAQAVVNRLTEIGSAAINVDLGDALNIQNARDLQNVVGFLSGADAAQRAHVNTIGYLTKKGYEGYNDRGEAQPTNSSTQSAVVYDDTPKKCCLDQDAGDEWKG